MHFTDEAFRHSKEVSLVDEWRKDNSINPEPWAQAGST